MPPLNDDSSAHNPEKTFNSAEKLTEFFDSLDDCDGLFCVWSIAYRDKDLDTGETASFRVNPCGSLISKDLEKESTKACAGLVSAMFITQMKATYQMYQKKMSDLGYSPEDAQKKLEEMESQFVNLKAEAIYKIEHRD